MAVGRRSGPGSAAARVATAVAGLALFAFALQVRALRRALVLAPEGVLPIDGDSFYHFRRIAFTVRNFPAFLSFDPYVNFPRGGEPIWSPSFDFALAVLVRAVLGDGDPAAMERFLAFVPAVLGSLHAALLLWLGRRFLSAPAAFAAGLLLAVLPAHFVYSQVGFVDHHVAVSLAGTLLLFAAMGFAARPGRARAAWLGLALAAALAIWPGALIHVGVAQAALLGFALSRSERDGARAALSGLAVAHALAAALLLPLCLGRTWVRWGALSPLVLSNFQPLWLGFGAVSFALLGQAFRRFGLPRSLLGRAAAAAALGTAVLALALVAFPELARSGAADAWAWLARGEEFQATVSESGPLLSTQGGGVDAWIGAELLSGGFLLAPLAALALVVVAVRRGRPDLGVLAFWAAAFLALALAQMRFAVDAAPALALMLCAAADAGLAALAPGRRRTLAAAAALALALALCLPVLDWYRSRPADGGGRVRGMALTVATGRWLRAHSPPTDRWLAPGAEPEYGVLAPWGWGHALRYAAQRPVVQDNFGDDVGAEGFDAAEAYFRAESEFAGLAILERLRVRYLVVGPTGSGHGKDYAPGSLFARLRRQDGGPAPAGATRLAGSSLSRHRLVYESEPLDAASAVPYAKLFEVVRGARLAGTAEPGAEVEARLRLHSRRRELGFVARAAADAAGRYVLVLPYATGAQGDVESAAHYELRSGGKMAETSVTEEQVQRGERIEAPPLRAAAGSAGDRRG